MKEWECKAGLALDSQIAYLCRDAGLLLAVISGGTSSSDRWNSKAFPDGLRKYPAHPEYTFLVRWAK